MNTQSLKFYHRYFKISAQKRRGGNQKKRVATFTLTSTPYRPKSMSFSTSLLTERIKTQVAVQNTGLVMQW
jgi:hypothetical protein